jgi:tryptophanyl-tRNA synthetase
MVVKKKKILTGIKPTGAPHLGNYYGAIKPALDTAKDSNYCSYYFIANYHALTTIHKPQELYQYTHEVAACWFAFGLDPKETVFFRQSDVPEILELAWILACFTSKGIMNRAHAYKALLEANKENADDPDAGINMGIYTYPILMGADILLFQSEEVPVGQDQVQHIEMARDMAKAFNSRYGELLILPKPKIQEEVATVLGLDGRKMSKSYDNTIPLFLPEEKLRKLVMRIKTDSSDPSAPKDPETSSLYKLYSLVASEEKKNKLKQQFASGISWGEVKLTLFEELNTFLTSPRTIYNDLMNDRGEIERMLGQGAIRAREEASVFLEKLKKAIGVHGLP